MLYVTCKFLEFSLPSNYLEKCDKFVLLLQCRNCSDLHRYFGIVDRWRHRANRNEIRVPGSTTATNVAVVVVFEVRVARVVAVL